MSLASIQPFLEQAFEFLQNRGFSPNREEWIQFYIDKGSSIEQLNAAKSELLAKLKQSRADEKTELLQQIFCCDPFDCQIARELQYAWHEKADSEPNPYQGWFGDLSIHLLDLSNQTNTFPLQQVSSSDEETVTQPVLLKKNPNNSIKGMLLGSFTGIVILFTFSSYIPALCNIFKNCLLDRETQLIYQESQQKAKKIIEDTGEESSLGDLQNNSLALSSLIKTLEKIPKNTSISSDVQRNIDFYHDNLLEINNLIDKKKRDLSFQILYQDSNKKAEKLIKSVNSKSSLDFLQNVSFDLTTIIEQLYGMPNDISLSPEIKYKITFYRQQVKKIDALIEKRKEQNKQYWKSYQELVEQERELNSNQEMSLEDLTDSSAILANIIKQLQTIPNWTSFSPKIKRTIAIYQDKLSKLNILIKTKEKEAENKKFWEFYQKLVEQAENLNASQEMSLDELTDSSTTLTNIIKQLQTIPNEVSFSPKVKRTIAIYKDFLSRLNIFIKEKQEELTSLAI